MTDVANRFEALFEAHHQHVLAYLLRRTEQPADAADVLAERHEVTILKHAFQ